MSTNFMPNVGFDNNILRTWHCVLPYRELQFSWKFFEDREVRESPTFSQVSGISYYVHNLLELSSLVVDFFVLHRFGLLSESHFRQLVFFLVEDWRKTSWDVCLASISTVNVIGRLAYYAPGAGKFGPMVKGDAAACSNERLRVQIAVDPVRTCT